MEDVKAVEVGNKTYRPVLDNTVTEYDVSKAELELNETSEIRESTLRCLKQELEQNENLNPRTDDEYLLRFLRARKFDCEKAQKLLEDYYSFREKHLTLYQLPSQVQKVLNANLLTFLPHRDCEGRAIIVTTLGEWDPREIPFTDLLANLQLLLEYLLDNPVTQINGFVNIWDCKDWSWRQIMEFISLKKGKLLLDMVQGRLPGRQKMAYLINISPLIEMGYQFFRPFLKRKFKERVRVLSNPVALHQYLDPDILPQEFGGKMPPINYQDIAQLILEKEDYISKDRMFGYRKKEV